MFKHVKKKSPFYWKKKKGLLLPLEKMFNHNKKFNLEVFSKIF